MINSSAHQPSSEWMAAIQEILKPHLHQVAYGNLRSELTHWEDPTGQVVNLAIVYEVPGGSTNQLNITWHESSATFSYLALDTQAECTTTALDEVLHMIQEAVTRIPGIRHARLCEDIDRWAAAGMTQKDLFQQMTLLLKIEDLRGGTITMPEMKIGIAYILAHYRTPSA